MFVSMHSDTDTCTDTYTHIYIRKQIITKCTFYNLDEVLLYMSKY